MDIRVTSAKATTFVTFANDVYVGKSLEVYGEWSYGEIETLAKLLAPTDNVVEAGSNVGAHTVFLARDVCPAGLVYAFEPRRLAFQLLCANLALNGIPNAHAFPLALGNEARVFEEGPIELAAPTNHGGLAVGDVEGRGELIEIVPLDSMLHRLPPIALLKADVEGAELSVLQGAEILIRRDRPILYLENDRPERSEALLRKVNELGYDLYWHSVPLYRQQNRAGTAGNLFGDRASLNVLCLPLEKRIKVSGASKIVDFAFHPMRGRAGSP